MQEKELKLMSGWPALFGVALGAAFLVVLIAVAAAAHLPWLAFVIVPGWLVWFVMLFGFVVNGPTTARVVQLFGTYAGTLRETGFFYGNPFYLTTKVTLRVRTFETGVTKTDEVKDAGGKVTAQATSSRRPLKVNDKDGTPIEIAAVVVWRVTTPSEAVFAVDDYVKFVEIQADAALRNLASHYSYDAPEADAHSLRGHIDQVAGRLREELTARTHTAGVEVVEARISTLAYAPEIAAAMLQRQQASAVIAARALIVDAAVGMVEHALAELSKRQVVELDSERRATMVSNLMVVLCSHNAVQPVLNTGTLYS